MRELEQQVDAECVVQGGRKRPVPADILAYQLLLLPVRLAKARAWAWQHPAPERGPLHHLNFPLQQTHPCRRHCPCAAGLGV
jgi:hypothetical protein